MIYRKGHPRTGEIVRRFHLERFGKSPKQGSSNGELCVGLEGILMEGRKTCRQLSHPTLPTWVWAGRHWLHCCGILVQQASGSLGEVVLSPGPGHSLHQSLLGSSVHSVEWATNRTLDCSYLAFTRP